MTLRIEIDLDNAAFHDRHPAHEVRRILKHVTGELRRVPPARVHAGCFDLHLSDVNGNGVGRAEVVGPNDDRDD